MPSALPDEPSTNLLLRILVPLLDFTVDPIGKIVAFIASTVSFASTILIVVLKLRISKTKDTPKQRNEPNKVISKEIFTALQNLYATKGENSRVEIIEIYRCLYDAKLLHQTEYERLKDVILNRK